MPSRRVGDTSTELRSWISDSRSANQGHTFVLEPDVSLRYPSGGPSRASCIQFTPSHFISLVYTLSFRLQVGYPSALRAFRRNIYMCCISPGYKLCLTLVAVDWM